MFIFNGSSYAVLNLVVFSQPDYVLKNSGVFFFVIFNTFFLNKPSDNKNSSNTHSYPFFWEKMPISSPFYSSSEQRHHVVDTGFICILSCLREVRNM